MAKYIVLDWLSATIAWTLFYVFRKVYLEPQKFGYEIDVVLNQKFWLGLIFIPAFWLALYAMMGSYRDVFRRHRLKDLGQTLWITSVGVIVIFFTLLLDDEIATFQSYYRSFFALFGLHFTFTFVFRFWLTSATVKKIHTKQLGFNTLIIGDAESAEKVRLELEKLKLPTGHQLIGYVSTQEAVQNHSKDTLVHLGQMNKVNEIIKEKAVEEVIIAVESSDHKKVMNIISELEGNKVLIKIIPDMYDILSGSVKMNSIFGAPLIEVNTEIMPAWQFSLKRLLDVLFSILALVLLSPLLLVVAVLVKTTSKGPVLFSQERIGKGGTPFYIYKFRSMVKNAEKGTPKLSSKGDARITKVGKFLRKTRIDEFPQFYNVLKGDMSLVGPRPERQFFIDQISKVAPHYRHLQKVRPGITSWGQVKFGYAENVDQMIERMKYDILYIENMTLALDFKIMAYTILTVLGGKGK